MIILSISVNFLAYKAIKRDRINEEVRDQSYVKKSNKSKINRDLNVDNNAVECLYKVQYLISDKLIVFYNRALKVKARTIVINV